MLLGLTVVVLSLFICAVLTLVYGEHELIITVAIFVYVFGYSISIGPLFMMYAI